MKIAKYLVLLLTINSSFLVAQNADSDDKKGTTFVLTGGATVSFEKGKKISEEPSFEDTVKVKMDVNYLSIDKKVSNDFYVETINPPKLLIMEPLEKIYHGNFDLGLNDFKSPPYFKFNYSTLRNKDYSAGVILRHFSSDLKMKSLAETRFTENNIELFGKKFYKRTVVNASADYDYNTFRNYGYDPVLFSVPTKDNQLYYSLLNLNASIETRNDDDRKFHHAAKVNYKQLFAKYAVQEHLIDVQLRTHSYNLFSGQIDSLLSKDKYLRMTYFELSGEHLLSTDSSLITEGTLFKVGVGYKLKSTNLTVDAKPLGFTFLTNRTGIRWTPNVNVDYAIAKDILIVYAGFNRSLDRNYYMTYFQNNPFIGADLPNVNTLLDYHVSVGLKGSLSSKTTFNLGLNYKDFRDYVLFVNDVNSLGNRKFNIITDDVVQKQFFGEMIYENKKLKTGAFAEFNIYEVFKNEAYHLPAFKAQVYAKYNVQGKFNLGTDLFYYGEQLALNTIAATIPVSTILLKPIFDFNINVEYHYSDRLGAFLKVNNILSTQHQRWNQYPNYGINILGGVSYTF